MNSALDTLKSALADRYRIERELGAVLGTERFLTEIKTTARLQHPRILPLLDSGDAAGLLYNVMPVITGETRRPRDQWDCKSSVTK